MAIRIPRGLLRGVIRFAVKPLLGPPFPFSLQRAWARIASTANAPSPAASTASLELNGTSALRAWPTNQGLPPTLVQVASDEILLDDATRLADSYRDAGAEVVLQRFEGYWHDFQSHAGILEAADEAIQSVATFLNARWE